MPTCKEVIKELEEEWAGKPQGEAVIAFGKCAFSNCGEFEDADPRFPYQVTLCEGCPNEAAWREFYGEAEFVFVSTKNID